MKTVLSGVQPSGNLHLGNYLGSIRNWLNMQQTHNCLFGIMDLHAITVAQNPKDLQKNIFNATATYLACGLDEKKVTIFQQSQISAHAELAWIFSTIAPMGWLNRMTQFKDKVFNAKDAEKRFIFSEKNPEETLINPLTGEKSTESSHRLVNIENITKSTFAEYFYEKANLGLYAYPVLMAADILLYKADFVPVGEDQKQHLELTRDLAGAFNRRFATEYFKLPEPLIIKDVKRIMSLQDGLKKMSKSEESDLSRINLTDEPELILKKIKKAKTDSQSFISYDENRKEIYNLLNIFSAISNKTPQELAKEYENLGNGKFKNDLAESLIEHLKPIQEKLKKFENDKSYIDKILKAGSEKAKEIADKTKNEIFEIIGLK